MENITINGREYVATAKPDDCLVAMWQPLSEIMKGV